MSMGDGIEAMERIKDRVLDDTFTTDLGGESRDFVESSSNTAFAFGLAFQLPVVLSLMTRAGLVTHTSLKKFRKYAIVIAFLAAAFLTPPDPFSQISLALPIIILYEISIYIAKLIQKKKDNE